MQPNQGPDQFQNIKIGELANQQNQAQLTPNGSSEKNIDQISERLGQNFCFTNNKRLRRYLIIKEKKQKKLMNMIQVKIEEGCENLSNPSQFKLGSNCNNKGLKQTYRYESRHNHAIKRQRDEKGRFLSKKNLNKPEIIEIDDDKEEKNQNPIDKNNTIEQKNMENMNELKAQTQGESNNQKIQEQKPNVLQNESAQNGLNKQNGVEQIFSIQSPKIPLLYSNFQENACNFIPSQQNSNELPNIYDLLSNPNKPIIQNEDFIQLWEEREKLSKLYELNLKMFDPESEISKRKISFSIAKFLKNENDKEFDLEKSKKLQSITPFLKPLQQEIDPDKFFPNYQGDEENTFFDIENQ